MILTDAFLQQAMLLLLGALVTGLGVPYVLRRIDQRKLRQQKIFEADLARQAKLIDAQASLLDEVTRLVWAWRYLAKQVVYYGARGDEERFSAAKKRYEDEVWGLLDALRTQISRSRRLISEQAFAELGGLYDYIVRDVDPHVSAVVEGPGIDRSACGDIAARFSSEVSTKLDDALMRLATALRLVSRTDP